MALVRIQDAPEVAANPNAGNDYQSISAPIGAFGGLTAQAGQRLGANLQQASGDLDATTNVIQARHNEVAVDQAFNQFQQGTDKLTYGDPTDPTAQPGLYSLKGADALTRGPGAVQDISSLRDSIRSNLQNPAQQLAFDEQSRRLMQYKSGEISQHLMQQSSQYALQTSQATVSNAAQSAANAWNSDDALKHSIEDARNGQTKAYQTQFGTNLGPELQQKAIREADTHVISAAVQSAAESDPVRAQKILNTYGGQIDPAEAARLTQRLQTAATGQQANGIVNDAMGLPSTAAGLDGFADRTIRGESGGDPSARNPRSSATGAGQFLDSTWVSMMRQHRPDLASGKSDADVLALRTNPDLSRDMVKAYAQDNADALRAANVAATPGNLLAAHRLGPDGAIKLASATPDTPMSALVQPAVMQANPQYRGKTAGQVQQGFDTEMAGVTLGTSVPGADTTNTAATPVDYETGMARVQAATAGNYRLQQMATTEFNRRYAAQAKAQKDVAEKAADTLTTQMIQDPTQIDPVKDIAQNPAFSAEQKEHWYSAYQRHLADFNANGGDKDSKTYGQGFSGYLRAVTAGPNDPGRITDPDKLVQSVGQPGGLTMAGYEKLSGLLKERGTPEGEAWVSMQRQFMSNVHGVISGKTDGPFGRPDNVGEENFLKFQAAALPAIEAARKAGKTPEQIFNPDSSDYVGKLATPFRRTQAQRLHDQYADESLDGSAPAAQPAQPAQPQSGGWLSSLFHSDPPPNLTDPNVVKQQVQMGKMTPAEGLARLTGRYRDPAAAAPGGLPMAQTDSGAPLAASPAPSALPAAPPASAAAPPRPAAAPPITATPAAAVAPNRITPEQAVAQAEAEIRGKTAHMTPQAINEEVQRRAQIIMDGVKGSY